MASYLACFLLLASCLMKIFEGEIYTFVLKGIIASIIVHETIEKDLTFKVSGKKKERMKPKNETACCIIYVHV